MPGGLSHRPAQGLNRQGRVRAVKHGVAVGAHRHEVVDRVHLIRAADLREGPQVMHFDLALAVYAVHLRHINPADLTYRTVMLNTPLPGLVAALVGLD